VGEINAGDQPAAVMKQKRPAAAKPNKKGETAPEPKPEPNLHHSSHAAKAPVVAEKKRWSREEVAAAKAEADKNKQRLNVLTDETDKQLMRMDIDDDN